MQQNTIGRTRIDHGFFAALDIEERIVLRHTRIAEPIIRLREITIAARGPVRRLQLRKQQAQIALALRAGQFF